MATGKEIAATTLQAYECDGGYIWGKMGVTWTAAAQAKMKKAYEANPEKNKNYKSSVQYGAKWIGHRVWDCAGLPRWAAKENGVEIHSGSNLIWDNDLSHRGVLTDETKLPIGALVFTGNEKEKPHVGTYTGNEEVTEASGAKDGVIKSKLHKNKWKFWGLEKGVTYDFIPDAEPNPKPDPGDKKPTLRKGSKNSYVKEMQTMLQTLGYDLGICGADGDFGTATEKALKEFQKDHDGPDGRALAVDGICGPATWWALQNAVDNKKPAEERYTVTVTGLTKSQAEELCREWSGATMKKE